MATQAKYYRDSEGCEPVRDYRSALAPTARAALDFHINLLNHKREDEPPPNFPTTSQVRGPLRELRVATAGTQHRILYRRSEQLIVLLHAFAKRTAGIPERDVELAEQRFDDFKERMDAEPRRRPRPVGSDAP